MITLDITKIQKYPYTLNIPYRIMGTSPTAHFMEPTPPPPPPPPKKKRICQKGSAGANYSQNEPHAIIVLMVGFIENIL